jgi:hypothetical protein
MISFARGARTWWDGLIQEHMKAVRSTRRVNLSLKKSISIWKRVIITMWRHQRVNARIGFGHDPSAGEVTTIDEAGEMPGKQRYMNIDPRVRC